MWFLIILAGIVSIPLVIEATRKPMTETARQAAPGFFADLPRGVTHYQWYGPEDGPVCVCIHGLTTPSFVWDGLAPELARMGFRVLTYDHYGRGYSDRTDEPQTAEFFVSHLNALLEDQKIDDDVTVVGYSMGGAIATAFAAAEPFGVRSVILLAPAGMSEIGNSLMRFIIKTPVLGRWLMHAIYPTLLRRGFKAEENLPSSVPGITRMQDAELDWRGFLDAVLSSLRHVLNGNLREAHATLNKERLPVLAIWGAEDSVIPITAAKTLQDWNPDVQTHVIEGAGHGLTYTHTAEVAARIDAFTQSDRR